MVTLSNLSTTVTPISVTIPALAERLYIKSQEQPTATVKAGSRSRLRAITPTSTPEFAPEAPVLPFKSCEPRPNARRDASYHPSRIRSHSPVSEDFAPLQQHDHDVTQDRTRIVRWRRDIIKLLDPKENECYVFISPVTAN
ncbi:hypothetical protein ON010_g12949 [Phytophthora cinnamomi]|nr:hypothetical protein ON010_g12949 [Phytophthora cinnamomi]